jgi:hypothetical protein
MCIPSHIPQYSSSLGGRAGETLQSVAPAISHHSRVFAAAPLSALKASHHENQPPKPPTQIGGVHLHAHAFTLPSLLYLPTNAHIAKIAALYHNKPILSHRDPLSPTIPCPACNSTTCHNTAARRRPTRWPSCHCPLHYSSDLLLVSSSSCTTVPLHTSAPDRLHMRDSA